MDFLERNRSPIAWLTVHKHRQDLQCQTVPPADKPHSCITLHTGRYCSSVLLQEFPPFHRILSSSLGEDLPKDMGYVITFLFLSFIRMGCTPDLRCRSTKIIYGASLQSRHGACRTFVGPGSQSLSAKRHGVFRESHKERASESHKRFGARRECARANHGVKYVSKYKTLATCPQEETRNKWWVYFFSFLLAESLATDRKDWHIFSVSIHHMFIYFFMSFH